MGIGWTCLLLHLCSLFLLGAASYGGSVTRCHGEKFDSLMCLPGRVVDVREIFVTASTTGGLTGRCRRSMENHTESLSANSTLFMQSQAACDGKLSCSGLTADLETVEDSQGRAYGNVSYIKIEYVCVNRTSNDTEFDYMITCPANGASSPICPSNTVIRITDIFIGLSNTSIEPCNLNLSEGNCIRRLGEDDVFWNIYLHQCDGPSTCDISDVGPYNQTGPCGGELDRQFTVVVHVCVPDGQVLSTTISTTKSTTDISTETAQKTTDTGEMTTLTIAETSAPKASETAPSDPGEEVTFTSDQEQETTAPKTSSPASGADTTVRATTASQNRRRRPLGIIAGIPLAVLVLVTVILVAVCYDRRQNRRETTAADVDETVVMPPTLNGMFLVPTESHSNEAITANHALQDPTPDPATDRGDTGSHSNASTMSSDPEEAPKPNGHRDHLDIINAPYPYDQVAFSTAASASNGAKFTVVDSGEDN